jgi:ketosteroid isomerase-like protein
MPDPAPKNFANVSAVLQQAAGERTADSAQHLRWIQTQIEAIERGEFGSVVENAHDDATLEIFAPAQFPFIKRAQGKPALLGAISHNFTALEEQQPEIRDIFSEGDTVVLFGRERGKVRQSGVRYDVEFVERFSFRDGKLASIGIVVADGKET